MTADRVFRVGLVGYGLGGAVFHAPLIAATPGLRLAAVVTADPARREQALRQHPGVRLFDTASQLWDASPQVDLVVIATPNRTHVTLGLAAMRAGLPVVIDKPFAPTVAEGQQLIEEAEKRQVALAVYHNRRWDGDFMTARQLVADGALGTIHRFESRFERWRPEPRPGWKERAAPEEAGGILFDLGTHLIDQALVLFGPVAGVHAELDCRRPGVEVEDDVFVALTHASGVRSHLWVSAVAAQHGPRIRLLGSSAAYTTFGLDPQEEQLRAGWRPGVPGYGEAPRERWGLLGVGDHVRAVPTQPGAYQRFYEGMVTSLATGAPPPVDPRDALATLRVIEGIREQRAKR